VRFRERKCFVFVTIITVTIIMIITAIIIIIVTMYIVLATNVYSWQLKMTIISYYNHKIVKITLK